LHLVVEQCLHLVAVVEQAGIGVDLDLHAAGQAFFHLLLEQQGALALRGVLGHDMET